MKLALRYIPTEVWVDIFCYPWISRKKLGQFVNKLGNRYFAEILQYCLHERGKQTLGPLNLSEGTLPDIPQTPMPENIKFFESITIWHFDSRTLDFLRQINTLFNGVNLDFGLDADLANLRTMLAHLLPMFHGIHSLQFNQQAIPLLQQYFAPILAQIKMFVIYFNYEQLDQATIQASINFCLKWLTSGERSSTEPRLLIFHICGADKFQQFCTAIKQQFLSAKSPCTFSIRFICYGIIRDHHHIADFHLENKLGEQLDGQFNEEANNRYIIFRHKQVDFAREQLLEWVKETVEKSEDSSFIELYRTTTIGPIDANAGDNEGVDSAGEEEAEDQPSTSKKPKLT